jgi:hypothetical protein
MSTHALTLRLSWRAIALLALAATFAIGLFFALRPASADLSGTIKGHAFTAGGTVANTDQPALQRVDLPPGGSQSSDNVNQGVPGVFNFHADSADSECSGNDSGAAITATCISDIHGVVVTAAGQTILTARRIKAESSSEDTGDGAHSSGEGTTYEGVCVFTSALQPCQEVGPDSSVPLNNLAFTGLIEIDHRDERSSDSGTEGHGLTVTGVRISLNVVGQGAVTYDIAQADSFVGGVNGTQDTDDDGIVDDDDNCPNTPNADQADLDHDGIGDVCDPDDDNDGVTDGDDNCPVNANHDQLDTDHDGAGDVCDNDDDHDGISDGDDNCRLVSNENQLDTDGDHVGDACDPDDDNDAVVDHDDNCVTTPNKDQLDTDKDGKGNACDSDDDDDGVTDGDDNCPVNANPDQLDSDNDSIGNACDPDDDNDGVPDGDDNCVTTPNPGQQDSDSDGRGDACDTNNGNPDGDGDGIPDGDDNCPTVPNHAQGDTDHDGIGNDCDSDNDNDGVFDDADNCPNTPNPEQEDTDGDGVGDACQHEGKTFLWGDVNCDGAIDVMDALDIILYGADYPYGKTNPCPDIGDEVVISGYN